MAQREPISVEKSLAFNNPQLASQWHPEKNGDLTPFEVSQSSGKKVWWKCPKGHEWQSIIANRTKGNGCPYCSRKMATPEACLATENPDLSREWHPTKNQNLTPFEVLSASRKKVWWLCKKGHEWEAAVYSRKAGSGCPYCYGRFATLETCLETVSPELALQWH